MRVTMLGTGAADGWPSPFCSCASCESMRASGSHRAPSSILVDGSILVDCGPTAPHAAGRAGVSLAGVRHVLVTHGHPDHLHPAFLLAWQWVAPDARLQVWGPPVALAACEPWLAEGAPVDLHPVMAGDAFALPTSQGTYLVRAIPAAHAHGDGDVLAEEALLYALEAPDAQRLLYATDTGVLAEQAAASLGGRFDAVIVECTFGAKADHGHGHLDYAAMPSMLDLLRTAGAIDSETACIATHLGHHNPPPPVLHHRLAALGLVALDDLEVLDTARGLARRPRRTLVTGGARSGKSRHAESLAADYETVSYVATAPPADADPEWAARLASHQARRPGHWATVETTDVAGALARAEAGSAVLVDCIGLWLTAQLDELRAWEDEAFGEHDPRLHARTAELVSAVAACPADVILVTNEAGQGVVPATRSGRLFRDCLGRVNAALAAACDDVTLLVAGTPLAIRSADSQGSRHRP